MNKSREVKGIRRDQICVTEKVDQENYSLFFLILKKENTQPNNKYANSKGKKPKTFNSDPWQNSLIKGTTELQKLVRFFFFF